MILVRLILVNLRWFRNTYKPVVWHHQRPVNYCHSACFAYSFTHLIAPRGCSYSKGVLYRRALESTHACGRGYGIIPKSLTQCFATCFRNTPLATANASIMWHWPSMRPPPPLKAIFPRTFVDSPRISHTFLPGDVRPHAKMLAVAIEALDLAILKQTTMLVNFCPETHETCPKTDRFASSTREF